MLCVTSARTMLFPHRMLMFTFFLSFCGFLVENFLKLQTLLRLFRLDRCVMLFRHLHGQAGT